MAKLVYKGNFENLPATREANSFYLCEDTRELYFGANLYTEAVRFYTGDKPTTPAQGVLYVSEATGAGDVWNGTAWKSVFTGIVKKTVATAIGAAASDDEVPTAKAVKDYVAGITGSELGELAHKDEVTEAELGTELAAKLNGKADQTDLDTANNKLTALIGNDAGKSARTIANEELAAQLIPENAKESMDTLAELAAWIQAHPDDASAMNQAITALQTLVGALPDDATSTTVVAYIKEYADAAIAALKIGDYAKAADLTAAVTRIATLEGKAHEHANKDLLDTYTQTEENLADAVSKKHTHENQAVLDGITATKVAAWDNAVDAITVGTF